LPKPLKHIWLNCRSGSYQQNAAQRWQDIIIHEKERSEPPRHRDTQDTEAKQKKGSHKKMSCTQRRCDAKKRRKEEKKKRRKVFKQMK